MPSFHHYRKQTILLAIFLIFFALADAQNPTGLNRHFTPYTGKAGYYLQLLENSSRLEQMVFDTRTGILPFSYYDTAQKRMICDFDRFLYDEDIARNKIKELNIILPGSAAHPDSERLKAIADKHTLPDSNCIILRLVYNKGWLVKIYSQHFKNGLQIRNITGDITYSSRNGRTAIGINKYVPEDKLKTEARFTIGFMNSRLTDFAAELPAASGGKRSYSYHYGTNDFPDKIYLGKDCLECIKTKDGKGPVQVRNRHLQHAFISDSLSVNYRQHQNSFLISNRSAGIDSMYYLQMQTDSMGRGFYFWANKNPAYNILTGHLWFFNFRQVQSQEKILLTEGYDNESNAMPAFAKTDGVYCLNRICPYFQTALITNEHGRAKTLSLYSYFLNSHYGNTTDNDCNNRLYKNAYTLTGDIIHDISAYAAIQRFTQYDISYLPNGLIKNIHVTDTLREQSPEQLLVTPPAAKTIYFFYKK